MPQAKDAWVHALLRPEAFEHPVSNIELIETHISWVILTGSFVYKLKKPVDLGFLDFSTLERRKRCAEAEVRLNQGLAPGLYLGVVRVTGSRVCPEIEGDGPLLDWAVKMVQFPQSAQLDRVLDRGELKSEQMDAFARRIAEFHMAAERVSAEEPYGSPAAVLEPVTENFQQIRQSGALDHEDTRLKALEEWSRSVWQALEATFLLRKREGFIRQCHGDLHLRNLAWIEGKPVAFDCIEFNSNLSRIDVLSDIAFLVMDLQDRGETALAGRFLNEYLQRTGDYEQLQVLHFYLTYRALVRAKVQAIRINQRAAEDTRQNRDTRETEDSAGSPIPSEDEDTRALHRELNAYLTLAAGYVESREPALLLTCGLSGSGKTTLTVPLVERLGAIRVRSDVERKRLHGLRSEDSGVAEVGAGIYDEASSQQTYQRLLLLARKLLEAGFTTIVDATFLERKYRDLFTQLAEELGCKFLILEIDAPPAVLRKRVADRKGDASDADVAVLEAQLTHWPSLMPDEPSLRIDTSEAVDNDELVASVRSALNAGEGNQ